MAAVDDSSDTGATPPPPAAEPKADEKPLAMPDQQPRWADPVFRFGLGAGFALLAVGIACYATSLIASTVSILIICSGLGIILGAFGSTAVINYKGFVIAGVAAISVALLFVVSNEMRESLLRIEIDGEVSGARLELHGDNPFPGADHGRRFEFYVLGRSVAGDRQRFALYVTLPEDAGNAERRTIEFECIPGTAILSQIGSGGTLHWSLDAKNGLLKNVEGRSIPSGPCVDAGGDRRMNVGLDLIGSAHAQDGNIPQLLADLDSDSATIRRDARDKLAAMGQAAVVPMMEHWEAQPDNYRVALGISVALTEFLRNHKRDRKAVSALLTEAHLRLLAAAAGDADRSLRIYASEFLYDLGDKRVVPIATALFPRASDDGRYQLIFVISGAVPELDAGERQALEGTLEGWQGTVGQDTSTLISDVLADLAR